MTDPALSLILAIATALTGICMILAGLLLTGFARHRLRVWNIGFAFSVAVLAFVRFAEYATGHVDPPIVVAVWVNLAIVSLIGLAGVIRLAKSDPPIWDRRKRER